MEKCKNYSPTRENNPYVDLICEGEVEDLSCIFSEYIVDGIEPHSCHVQECKNCPFFEERG